MSTVYVVDAAGHIPWSQLPYPGGLRYVSAYPVKNLTPAELAEAKTAKKEVGLVYEDDAMDFAGGSAVGLAKAKIAEPILAALPWPAERPVYAALDGDLPAAQYAAAWAGVCAFADYLKRPRAVYGPRPFLLYCSDRGCKYLWELGSADFNTGTEPTDRSLQQLNQQVYVAGVQCDLDQVFVLDWGQVPAPALPKPPVPHNPVSTEGSMTFFVQATSDAPVSQLGAEVKTDTFWFINLEEGTRYISPGTGSVALVKAALTAAGLASRIREGKDGWAGEVIAAFRQIPA